MIFLYVYLALKKKKISFAFLRKLHMYNVYRIYKMTHSWERSWIFPKRNTLHPKQFFAVLF